MFATETSGLDPIERNGRTFFLQLPGHKSMGKAAWKLHCQLRVYMWLGMVRGHWENHMLKGLPRGFVQEDQQQEIRTVIEQNIPFWLRFTGIRSFSRCTFNSVRFFGPSHPFPFTLTCAKQGSSLDLCKAQATLKCGNMHSSARRRNLRFAVKNKA